MAQLAKHADGQTITRLEEIAQREAVSANFLVQILNDLRRAGLVVSKRGKLGGYHLSGKAEDITLFDIVQAVEPSVLSLSTTIAGDSGAHVSQAWKQAGDALVQSLSNINLCHLAGLNGDPMFYI